MRLLSKKIFWVSLTAVIAVLFLAGCAAKTAEVKAWGDVQTGLILTYRIPADAALTYESSSDSSEVSEVMGQTIEVTTESASNYSFRTLGQIDGNPQLEVTVNKLSMDINSPQGGITPDMSGITGKTFKMTMSILGKELDTSEAAKLEYDLIGGQKRNLQSGFQTFFNDLPDRPVKVGDTWTGYDTIEESSETNSLTIESESTYTLVGFETVDGFECAKIETKVTGSITGKGTQQGMDLTTTGDLAGTDTWYFAYKEGYLISNKMEIEVDATVEVTGPANMTIPSTRVVNSEMSLIK